MTPFTVAAAAAEEADDPCGLKVPGPPVDDPGVHLVAPRPAEPTRESDEADAAEEMETD